MADPTDTGAGAAPAGPPPAEGAPPDQASIAAIVADVRSLWSETVAQARGVSELAVLELELAAGSLRKLLVASLVLAGMALSTWLFLVGMVAAVMLEYGVSLPLALLAGAVFNLLAAGALIAFIRSLARDMTFRNLRRYLADVTREPTADQSRQAA